MQELWCDVQRVLTLKYLARDLSSWIISWKRAHVIDASSCAQSAAIAFASSMTADPNPNLLKSASLRSTTFLCWTCGLSALSPPTVNRSQTLTVSGDFRRSSGLFFRL